MNEALRAAREALVWRHLTADGTDSETVLRETFEHPRHEVIPTGEVFDGTDEVLAYYRDLHTAFPDEGHEEPRLYHTDDAVIVELYLTGTHQGDLYGYPATGRSMRCPMVVFFFFDGERLTCKRLYFDRLTMLSQLGMAPDLTRKNGSHA